MNIPLHLRTPETFQDNIKIHFPEIWIKISGMGLYESVLYLRDITGLDKEFYVMDNTIDTLEIIWEHMWKNKHLYELWIL